MWFIIFFMTGPLAAMPADTLSLTDLYERVYSNYPLMEKAEIQHDIERLRRQVVRSRYYPSVELSATASYQSDVTEIDFIPPGGDAPGFSKDRYNVSVELNQPIYTGGAVSLSDRLEQAESEVERQSVETAMQQVRQQVDEIYFNILLMQQESKVLELVSEELRERLKEVRSNVENGTVLPGQQKILEAELIKNRQDSIRTRSAVQAGFRALGELAGEEIPASTELRLPETDSRYENDLPAGHPQYGLFSARQSVLDTRRELSKAEGRPKLSAFGTAAYGRPGLNMFEDDLQPYYIVGVRMQWNLRNWLNSGKKAAAVRYEQHKLQSDEQAFTRQLNAGSRRILEEIRALESLLAEDGEIIRLRRDVVRESRSRLDNGAITSTEFVSELQEANRAELARYLHRVQLIQKKIEYLTHTGQSWK